MSIKALLFDLDDTLYDEKQFVKSGFEEVAKFINNKFNIGEKIFYKILIDIFNGGARGNIFNLALEKINAVCEENIIRAMVKIYREHNPKIKLAEDVKSLLGKLKEIYSLGIVTDGFFKVQKKEGSGFRAERII